MGLIELINPGNLGNPENPGSDIPVILKILVQTILDLGYLLIKKDCEKISSHSPFNLNLFPLVKNIDSKLFQKHHLLC